MMDEKEHDVGGVDQPPLRPPPSSAAVAPPIKSAARTMPTSSPLQSFMRRKVEHIVYSLS